jgi:hypothetical protein
MNEFFNKIKPEYLKKIKKRGTSKWDYLMVNLQIMSFVFYMIN